MKKNQAPREGWDLVLARFSAGRVKFYCRTGEIILHSLKDILFYEIDLAPDP
jgi:hypothetical protein